MSRIPENPGGNVPAMPEILRITPEETASSHVDDLLKRHASLRGEQGITRDRGRKWYYQNWFIFMLAGTLAALLAYGLLDPWFSELTYIQGPVTAIDTAPSHAIVIHEGDQSDELAAGQYVECRWVAGLWLSPATRAGWERIVSTMIFKCLN